MGNAQPNAPISRRKGAVQAPATATAMEGEERRSSSRRRKKAKIGAGGEGAPAGQTKSTGRRSRERETTSLLRDDDISTLPPLTSPKRSQTAAAVANEQTRSPEAEGFDSATMQIAGDATTTTTSKKQVGVETDKVRTADDNVPSALVETDEMSDNKDKKNNNNNSEPPEVEDLTNRGEILKSSNDVANQIRRQAAKQEVSGAVVHEASGESSADHTNATAAVANRSHPKHPVVLNRSCSVLLTSKPLNAANKKNNGTINTESATSTSRHLVGGSSGVKYYSGGGGGKLLATAANKTNSATLIGQPYSKVLHQLGGIAGVGPTFEDQRERVRNWLQSQPFTEPQAIELAAEPEQVAGAAELMVRSGVEATGAVAAASSSTFEDAADGKQQSRDRNVAARDATNGAPAPQSRAELDEAAAEGRSHSRRSGGDREGPGERESTTAQDCRRMTMGQRGSSGGREQKWAQSGKRQISAVGVAADAAQKVGQRRLPGEGAAAEAVLVRDANELFGDDDDEDDNVSATYRDQCCRRELVDEKANEDAKVFEREATDDGFADVIGGRELTMVTGRKQTATPVADESINEPGALGSVVSADENVETVVGSGGETTKDHDTSATEQQQQQHQRQQQQQQQKQRQRQIEDLSSGKPRRQQTVDDSCSLCHYLDSIQTVMAQEQADSQRSHQGQKQKQSESADAKVGVCQHRLLQQAAPSCDHNGSPLRDGFVVVEAEEGECPTARSASQIGTPPPLCCCDRRRRIDYIDDDDDARDEENMERDIGRRRSSSVKQREEAEFEDVDCGLIRQTLNPKIDSATAIESTNIEEDRPSSAHSRLCPTPRKLATETDTSSERLPLDESHDNYNDKFPEHQQLDQAAEPNRQQKRGTARGVATSQRAPLMKALRGGLSLDAYASNSGGGGANSNKQQSNDYHQKRQPHQHHPSASHRHQHSRNSVFNSKPCLASQRCKSNSGKLIVINSNNVSYTIQVATENTNEKDTAPTGSREQVQSSDDQTTGRDSGASDDLKQATATTPISSSEIPAQKEGDNLRQQQQQQQRKKFLVKKIPAPNLRRSTVASSNKKKKPETAQDIKTDQSRLSGDEIARKQSSSSGTGPGETPIADAAPAPVPVPARVAMKHDTTDPSANASSSSGSRSRSNSTSAVQASDSSANERAMVSLSPPGSTNDGSGVRFRGLASRSGSGPGSTTGGGGAGAGAEMPYLLNETSRSCDMAAKRLRELVAHLEHGSVPQSVLYQTLEYAASVLDSVTMDQISRVSDEEDGDLSEVQSDAVPNEVRKWLETTFTRNSISQKRKSEDKLKFRSVANAIRAGIVVDRIYRRMSASTPFVSAEVSSLLKSIDDWSFDCFAVNQVSNGQVLKSVGYELFNRYGLMYKFKIPTTTLKNFLTQIESGYVKHKNPYHNNLHAADVTQTVHYMLWQAGLTNWLTDLEIFATLIAAIIHDYLHTGTTNNFHVMSQSDTALIYNDRAVLENFHICQAFTLMRNEDCNILAGLSKDEYREFRSLVIDMVLATDMSSHFQQIKAMKNILNHSDNFNADKSKVLSLMIHISDISHPAKEWELHSNWTQLLMEEFFRQGDREKELGLDCSPLCDRETTLVPESQLGFIEFIVSPSLEVCGDVLDHVHYHMAEANARPVLPASAKAASIVAVSGSPAVVAIEAPPPAPATSVALRPAAAVAATTDKPVVVAKQVAPQKQVSITSSSSGSISGFSAASAQAASESLTSNLRKMIASSSASIGRKLNISTSSISGVQHPTQRQQPQKPEPTVATTITTTSNNNSSDFEQRQANYKHPVIKCDSSVRPKSSDPRVRQQQQHGDSVSEQEDNNSSNNNTNRVASSQGLRSSEQKRSPETNRLQQPVDATSAKRNTSSALVTCSQSSRSAPQLPFSKIYRPWIKCLERNKRMWQERAARDAQARELKEKLAKQEISSSQDESDAPQNTN